MTKDWQDYQSTIDYTDGEWQTDWSWSDEFCFELNEYAAYCRDWS